MSLRILTRWAGLIATADYGTNGGTALSRPDSVPARSDSVLVTTTSYNSAGRVASTTNPAGIASCLEYDAAGRQAKVVLNCVSGSSSSGKKRSHERVMNVSGTFLTQTSPLFSFHLFSLHLFSFRSLVWHRITKCVLRLSTLLPCDG